jgi:hypothetical protein
MDNNLAVSLSGDVVQNDWFHRSHITKAHLGNVESANNVGPSVIICSF